MRFSKIAKRAGALLLALAIIGCASGKVQNADIPLAAGPAAPVPAEASPYAQYLIAPGDNVEVRFPYSPEFSDQLLVQPDGYIPLAFIGPVLAAGKTPQALQDDIRRRYAELARSERDASGGKTYRIQVGDELAVKFPYQSEFDQLTVVRPDGRISLALVGAVVAEDKSPEALTDELKEAYGGQLRQPELVVMVQGFSSNRYYVDDQARYAALGNFNDPLVVLRSSTPMQIFVGGEVRSPGFFPYTGPVSAMQAIIMAGGNTLSGELGKVAIIRRSRGEEGMLFLRNLRQDVVAGGDEPMPLELAALGDLALQPNDVVIVPKSTIAKVNDYLNQYLYNLIPALRNSSFGFVYNLRNSGNINSVITVPGP